MQLRVLVCVAVMYACVAGLLEVYKSNIPAALAIRPTATMATMRSAGAMRIDMASIKSRTPVVWAIGGARW